MTSKSNGRITALLDRRLSGPVFSQREIMKMMLPFLLDALSVQFINMLITALISRAGDESVAAVNLVNPITSLIVCLLNGIAAGGTVAVTQCLGLGDDREVRRAAGHILWLTALVGTLFCLPFLAFPRQITRLLYPSAEAAVLAKAASYLRGSCLSILVFTIYTGVFCILRGLGESQRGLVLTIIINVSYLLFSILFINWLNMDIRGSVLALNLARLVGSAAAVWILFFWRPPISMGLKDLFSFDKSLLRSILHVSIPFGLEQIFLYGGNIVVEMYMVLLGTGAIATHAVANSLLALLTSCGWATGNLAVTIVGRCMGADHPEEAYRYGKRMISMGTLLLIAFGLIFYPLLPQLLGLYHPSAESARLSTSLLLWSIPSLLLFWPMSNIMPYTLRAANDTVFPSVLSLITMWVIRIGVGYALSISLKMGLWGVWISTWLEWALRTGALLWRFLSRKWLHPTTIRRAN